MIISPIMVSNLVLFFEIDSMAISFLSVEGTGTSGYIALVNREFL